MPKRQIKLSHSHPCHDICDELKGRYPKSFKWVGWHPNDLCYAVPIIKSEEKWWEDENNRGNDNDEITDVPQGFKTWVVNNQDRIARAERRGTLPYFVRDNKVVVRAVNSSSLHFLEDNVYNKSLKDAQKFLLRQKYENLVVLTPKGKVVFKATGNVSNIYFSDEDAKLLANNIVIHNHPEGFMYSNTDLRRVGHSLSSSDLKEAVQCNVLSIVAISPQYSYELKRPLSGWGVDTHVIYKQYDKIYKSLKERYIFQLNEYREVILQHLTMKELSKLFGFIYIKKKIR